MQEDKGRSATSSATPVVFRAVEMPTATPRPAIRLPRPEPLDLGTSTPEPPRRKLSLARLALFLLILAGAATAGFVTVRSTPPVAGASARLADSWFSPYVDVTLTPTYPFETPDANPVGNVTLGFIVAAHSHACTPSWGNYYSLDQAQASLGLDARIRQVQGQGGNATVSFGGEDNSELADSCTSTAQLRQAYASVIDRYRLTSVDFDIEGAAVTNTAANARRATALAALQRSARAHGSSLQVWLTLPVTAQGFQAAELAAIRSTLAGGVSLAGVNLLAMDFGTGQVPGHSMLTASLDALRAAHSQVEAIDQQQGGTWSSAGVWNHLGVTVMIGQNDIANERFTLDDARGLRAFVAHQHIARLSIWSLNRDRQCGSVFAEVGVQSDTCSGVAQTPLEFTKILSRLSGTSVALAPAATAAQEPTISSPAVDNQATSPYPIWRSTAAYDTGYKVVWHHSIYEAKWFNQGDAPDSLENLSQSPWLLIGPVLSGERYPATPKLTASQQTPWSATAVYQAGDVVEYEGYPYAARWYTKGQSPEVELPIPSSSAWRPLWQFPGEPAQ